MRIFLSYGFNERDKWIPELVGPLIRAFGAEDVTGEQLHGERITDGVRERIQGCDGLIAFATRRGEPDGSGQYGTHRWVTDELTIALTTTQGPGGRPINVLELREEGVSDQGGFAGDRQHVKFTEADMARVLVDIARVVGDWSRGLTMRFKVRPEGVVKQLRPALSQPGFSCTYELNEDGRILSEQPATIIKRAGGLEVIARGLPPKSLLRVKVVAGGKTYGSEFSALDSLTVTLEDES